MALLAGTDERLKGYGRNMYNMSHTVRNRFTERGDA
jgi:hypothetical protein